MKSSKEVRGAQKKKKNGGVDKQISIILHSDHLPRVLCEGYEEVSRNKHVKGRRSNLNRKKSEEVRKSKRW